MNYTIEAMGYFNRAIDREEAVQAQMAASFLDEPCESEPEEEDNEPLDFSGASDEQGEYNDR